MQIDLPIHDFVEVTHEDGSGNYMGTPISLPVGFNYEIIKTTVWMDSDYIPNFTHFVRRVL